MKKSESSTIEDTDEYKRIRILTKVVRLYIQSVETNLQEIKNMEQTLQKQVLEDLKIRLQVATNERWRLKVEFEALLQKTLKIQMRIYLPETVEEYLIKQRQFKALKDKCTELVTDFLERMKDEDEDWKIVKEMKNKAIQICAEVSGVLAGLMITVSESQRAVENFQVFRSALGCVEEDLKGKSVVISKFCYMMKMIGEGMEKMKKEKNEKGKKAVSKLIYPVIVVEGVEKTKKEKTEEMKVVEAKLEELLDKFLREMMRLELVMNSPGVPDAKKLSGSAMEVLKARVEICKKIADDLEKEVTDLQLSNKIVDESGKLIGSSLLQGMQEVIGVEWRKLKDEAVDVEVDGGRTTTD